jgi:hypothetical protein
MRPPGFDSPARDRETVQPFNGRPRVQNLAGIRWRSLSLEDVMKARSMRQACNDGTYFVLEETVFGNTSPKPLRHWDYPAAESPAEAFAWACAGADRGETRAIHEGALFDVYRVLDSTIGARVLEKVGVLRADRTYGRTS